jgi:hypothetical protein
MIRARVVLLTIVTLFSLSGSAAAQDKLAKEGLFSSGIGVIPIALGPLQVFSVGGHATGLRLSTGAQIDLGPRWALRLPLVIASAGGTDDGYAEIGVAPGVIYRLRNRADESFTPYVGAAVKFGGFGAERPLLGKPRVATPAVSHGDIFEEHHHSDDPNFDVVAGTGAEASLGGSWHATRLLSLDFDLTGELLAIDGALVHALAETVALRFTF